LVEKVEDEMNAVVQIQGKPSLIATMASKYGVDTEKMLTTLKATAFRGDVSTEQLMALCIVANQYNLNPWTKEIYAFPDRNNGIVPVVGVDGWSRIINEHPQCDGIQFAEADDGSWIECTIFRKDRKHPTSVREYMSEVRRDTQPWRSHPRRMLRHKALIQCARIAFGFAGIYDPDEAERVIEAEPSFAANPRDGIEAADPTTVDSYVGRITDILASDVEEEAHADLIFLVHQEVCSDDSVYTALLDALKARGVIKTAGWKQLVALGSKRYQERKAAEALQR
jgi:phage recombination protein Bet